MVRRWDLLCIVMAGFAGAGDADDTELLGSRQEGAPGNARLVFQTRGASSVWRPEARVYVDAAAYFENENELSNGTEMRQARFSVNSLLWHCWRAELDVDLAGDRVDLEDAWLAYERGPYHLRIGNFKEPFGLERNTSSARIAFMERALPDLFAPGRQTGVALFGHGGRWFAAGGLFGQEADDEDAGADEGYGVTGRLVCLPLLDEGRSLHIGLGATRRTPDSASSDRIRFRTRPETRVSRERFLDTGWIRDVDCFTVVGVEGAMMWGPLHLQGECVRAQVHRTNRALVVDLSGGYVYVSWCITGQSRPYLIAAGEFAPLVPEREAGAWELALRYSTVDLDDVRAGVLGGEAENVTLGLNWYANPGVRIMANLTRVNNGRHANGGSLAGKLDGGDDFTFLQMRWQVVF